MLEGHLTCCASPTLLSALWLPAWPQVPNLIFQIEEFERHLIRLSAGGERVAGAGAGCLAGALSPSKLLPPLVLLLECR